MASYDNATRYNDYVVSNIINLFKDKNCCIIYFSDHGEEVFDQGDYNGHGGIAVDKSIEYQFRVPLMIYASESYRKLHPDIENALKSSLHKPIITDDISHCILEIAGIKSKWFNPTRSFINKSYNSSKHRIVKNSIDFDQKRPTFRGI